MLRAEGLCPGDLCAEGLLRSGFHLRAEDLLPEALQARSDLPSEDLRAEVLRAGVLCAKGLCARVLRADVLQNEVLQGEALPPQGSHLLPRDLRSEALCAGSPLWPGRDSEGRSHDPCRSPGSGPGEGYLISFHP